LHVAPENMLLHKVYKEDVAMYSVKGYLAGDSFNACMKSPSRDTDTTNHCTQCLPEL